MGSDQDFVAYVCEQLRDAGGVTSRRMFGEAAVYLDANVVGMVCDNQFFVKPTVAGRAVLGVPSEAPPYPGASNWFLIADLDDRDFLSSLIRATADALPAPKVKSIPKAGKAKPRKATRPR